MSKKQKKESNSHQMAKPSYHAYRIDENIIDKFRIVLSRPAKKICKYLSRMKNWIKNHRNPVTERNLSETDLVEDHILDSMCSVEPVTEEEIKYEPQNTDAVPLSPEDEQYVGRHARK